jgi:hypothetical protein
MGWKTRISVTLVVILRLIAVSLVAITDGNRAELERVLPFGACVSAGERASGRAGGAIAICCSDAPSRVSRESNPGGSIAANDRRRHLCASECECGGGGGYGDKPPVAFGHLCPGV